MTDAILHFAFPLDLGSPPSSRRVARPSGLAGWQKPVPMKSHRLRNLRYPAVATLYPVPQKSNATSARILPLPPGRATTTLTPAVVAATPDIRPNLVSTLHHLKAKNTQVWVDQQR